jgi:hypothetical protein
MKKLIIGGMLIALLATSMVFAGCERVDLAEKNGPITTQSYNFTDFTGIDVGYAFELIVTPSSSYSVTITAGENVLDHINVHQDGSVLVFDIDNWIDIWWTSFYNPKVNITMPMLEKLELSGASKATVTGFSSEHDFDLHVSGASEIDLDMAVGDFFTEISGASHVDGHLTAISSDIGLSGASRIKLTGSGGNIRLEGSGASDVDLKGYAVNNASIDFSGASHASMTVNGRLDVELSGASSLDYYGNPTIGSTDISGSSSMNHKTTP